MDCLLIITSLNSFIHKVDAMRLLANHFESKLTTTGASDDGNQ